MKWKKIVPLLLTTVLLTGCSGNKEKTEGTEKIKKSETEKTEETGKVEKVKEMDRAVFAWEGVDEEGLDLIRKYEINTVLLDYNHTSDFPILASYTTFVLAGSPEWGSDEMKKVAEEAETLGADGVVFDIENDYATLADNLENLNTSFPVYVCIPFWLDDLEKGNEQVGDESGKEVVERIIKFTDGVFVMNYYKGEEGKQAEFELKLARQNRKKIWTIYELQPPGVYDLKEYNTYYSDGIAAVEENYKEQFSGTEVGVAFHNLEMMKELDK